MITNERQYKITRKQLDRLRDAIAGFDVDQVANRVGAKALAKAELEALKSELQVLEAQLFEYESLRTGQSLVFEASELEDLPRMLIRARIAQGLSQRELAERLGMKEQQIQRYESEEYASASLRRLLEIAEALKLNIKETVLIKSRIFGKDTETTREIDWSKFPVKEMYRRGWFEDFTGSLDEAVQQTSSLLQDFVLRSLSNPALALHRISVRSDASVDTYALLAWECRVLQLAQRKKRVRKFQLELISTKWICELVHTSLQEDGPSLAQKMFEEVGIPLIVEPYLSNTYLDGAALLSRESPVIGMTLRYDRLDNFWFVLLHELIHILKHLHKGDVEAVFDNLDADSTEELEREADALASEALIPQSEWTTALPRYVRSEEAVREFASVVGVHPAVVAGRIRHEANNYSLLTDLVGQNQVRRHFREVSFGK